MRSIAGILAILSALIPAQGQPGDYASDSLAVRAILDSCVRPSYDSNGQRLIIPVDRPSLTSKANGRIEYLNLNLMFRNGNGISESQMLIFGRSLGKLTALKGLNLQSNNLKRVPEELFTLDSLRQLSLTDNDTGVISPRLSELKSLVALSLFGMSPLLTTVPRVIFDIPKLVSLDLGGNAIVELPREIGTMTNLVWLDLVFNLIASIPEEIGNLESLYDLELWHNQITTLPATIGRLNQLKYITLEENALHRLPDSIVLLNTRKAFFGGNYLCSLSCPIQQWLDARASSFSSNSDSWRDAQDCSILPVPICSSLVSSQKRNAFRLSSGNIPAILFDIRGRAIRAYANSNGHRQTQLLSSGIYIKKHMDSEKGSINLTAILHSQ